MSVLLKCLFLLSFLFLICHIPFSFLSFLPLLIFLLYFSFDPSEGCYRYIFPCRHIGSKLCEMSIHYRQYTDIFSILNYLQNHCLWRKKRSKVGPILSRKCQITYKIIVCGEKNSQNWYYIIQKIIERSILACHVQCLLQKRTSHRVAGAF